jgi:hypothetical protein
MKSIQQTLWGYREVNGSYKKQIQLTNAKPDKWRESVKVLTIVKYPTKQSVVLAAGKLKRIQCVIDSPGILSPLQHQARGWVSHGASQQCQSLYSLTALFHSHQLSFKLPVACLTFFSEISGFIQTEQINTQFITLIESKLYSQYILQ